MALADTWYSSGTFWAAAGTLAVLISGSIATFITIWLANPVRRLECVMSAAPLLQGSAQEMPGGLRITWNGDELEDPHILEVSLISRGRRDIGRDDFDQPLELRVGAKILAILRPDSSPDSSAFRTVAFEDDILKAGPGLIRRDQPIKFTLLAAGRDPVLTSAAAALRDVDVEVLRTEPSGHRWSATVKLAASLTVAAVMAGLVLIGLAIGHNPSAANNSAVGSSAPTSAPPTATGPLVAAEAALKSGSPATQLSGISTLQRIMKTSPADQPTAIQALTEFIRAKSPSGSNDQPVTTIIQTALTVLRNRNPVHDGGVTINLSSVNFTNAILSGIDLNDADLIDTDFSGADLSSASFRDADLNYAFFGGANVAAANFGDANLTSASFYQTIMCRGSLPTQSDGGYSCSSD